MKIVTELDISNYTLHGVFEIFEPNPLMCFVFPNYIWGAFIFTPFNGN